MPGTLTSPTVASPAAINSDGPAQAGKPLLGVDPVFLDAVITGRKWLRGSTVLATTNAYVPDAPGTLVWAVEGTGDDGSTIQSASTITVAAATPPGDQFADFVNRNYSTGAFASVATLTRASRATDLLITDPAGQTYQTYAADVPRFRNGEGLLLENASRSNLLASPTAPASQTVTLPATGTFVLWVNGTGSATITLGTAAGGIGKSGALANSGVATNGTPAVIHCSTAGTVTVAVAGILNAFQLEAGLAASSFIPFQGTRASETTNIIGPMRDMLLLKTATAIVGYKPLRSCPTFATALQAGGSLATGSDDEQVNATQSNGGGSATAALGVSTSSGNAPGLIKQGVAWDTTSRGVCANGGTVTTGGAQYVTGGGTNTRLGVANFMGIIQSLTVYAFKRPYPALRSATELATPQIVQLGESLVVRADGMLPFDGNLTGKSIPRRLGEMIGKTVLNAGVNGQSTATQLARYQLHPELFSIPLIIGINGWNDTANNIPTATIVANIQAMAALNTSGKVLVLGTITGYAANEAAGQVRNQAQKDLQVALAAAFGANFLDIRQTMVDAADLTNPVDVLYKAQDQIGYTFGLPRASVPVFLTAPIDAIQSTATINISPGAAAPYNLQLDNEMVRVIALSGTTITITRNFGTGGTAAAHASGKLLRFVPDGNTPHLGDETARPRAASAIATKLGTLWTL